MATTTAAFTLSSSDISSSPLSKSTTATLTKAGTTIGLQQTSGMSRRILKATETSIADLISTTPEFTYTADKANKVYICNSSADSTDYVTVTIHAEEIGRLYTGDWMFMPWSASDSSSDIRITAASTHTNAVTLDYMVIGEGNAA
jgi:hypothetical protein|tara:strand:- start:649 stop:1083 length:435 start_codon:yes stop_codon:yes gene_type:complete